MKNKIEAIQPERKSPDLSDRPTKRFNLWQAEDMQEPVDSIVAKTYKEALEMALESCGYRLTIERNKDGTN
jgi:hypothetical protein